MLGTSPHKKESGMTIFISSSRRKWRIFDDIIDVKASCESDIQKLDERRRSMRNRMEQRKRELLGEMKNITAHEQKEINAFVEKIVFHRRLILLENKFVLPLRENIEDIMTSCVHMHESTNPITTITAKINHYFPTIRHFLSCLATNLTAFNNLLNSYVNRKEYSKFIRVNRDLTELNHTERKHISDTGANKRSIDYSFETRNDEVSFSQSQSYLQPTTKTNKEVCYQRLCSNINVYYKIVIRYIQIKKQFVDVEKATAKGHEVTIREISHDFPTVKEDNSLNETNTERMKTRQQQNKVDVILLNGHKNMSGNFQRDDNNNVNIYSNDDEKYGLSKWKMLEDFSESSSEGSFTFTSIQSDYNVMPTITEELNPTPHNNISTRDVSMDCDEIFNRKVSVDSTDLENMKSEESIEETIPSILECVQTSVSNKECLLSHHGNDSFSVYLDASDTLDESKDETSRNENDTTSRNEKYKTWYNDNTPSDVQKYETRKRSKYVWKSTESPVYPIEQAISKVHVQYRKEWVCFSCSNVKT